MPNSQENKNEGLKKTLKSLAWWISFGAKFMPSPLKLWAVLASTLLGGVVAILNDCDVKQKQKETPPIQTPGVKTPRPTEIYETRPPCNDAWCF